MRRALATFATLPLLTGCPPKDDLDSGEPGDPGIDCSADAHASVLVRLADGSGAAISGATVTWEAGTGREDCQEMTTGEYVCGWEVAGSLSIVAEADGYLPGEVEVDVEADECHVLTETVELVLSPG